MWVETSTSLPTRTDKIPNTSATATSAGADLNMARRLRQLVKTLKERLAQVAI
ncbi:MAG: hypothetical protein R2880_14250 [Deinococcales bacterium]